MAHQLSGKSRDKSPSNPIKMESSKSKGELKSFSQKTFKNVRGSNLISFVSYQKDAKSLKISNKKIDQRKIFRKTLKNCFKRTL